MTEKTVTKAAQEKFTKEQLIKSGRWSADVLNAVLGEKEYTIAEADRAVNIFYKRRVN